MKSPILGHCPCTEIFPNSRILKSLKKVFRKDDQCVANVILQIEVIKGGGVFDLPEIAGEECQER